MYKCPPLATSARLRQESSHAPDGVALSLTPLPLSWPCPPRMQSAKMETAFCLALVYKSRSYPLSYVVLNKCQQVSRLGIIPPI